MTLAPVSTGDPHTEAHNDEREAINDLLQKYADLVISPLSTNDGQTAFNLENGTNTKAALDRQTAVNISSGTNTKPAVEAVVTAKAPAIIAENAIARSTITKHAPTLGLYFPEAEGAVANGTTNDAPAIQAAVNAAVAAGGGTVMFRQGKTYKINTTIYVNSNGTTTGGPVDRIKIDGPNAKIDATGLAAAFSLGFRQVESNSQVNLAGQQQISFRITVENIEIIGSGLRWYGCQRASGPRNVRIDLTGVDNAQTTIGMFAVFCSTFLAIGTRVDNGGSGTDAWVLDTCSNALILGGGGNYCRRGLVVRAIYNENSGRTTNINTLGFHTEGNRRQFYDLQAVGSGSIVPHIVTSDTWEYATYPLIELGSDATSTCINLHIRGGYATGSGVAGTVGTAVRVNRADGCLVDGMRITNVAVGINRTANSTKFVYRRCTFDTVTTNVTGDSGAPLMSIPGCQAYQFSSQNGVALAAGQTISLTMGGVNSATAQRVPVVQGGSIVGIALRVNTVPTAGSVTVQVQKNNVDISGCTLVKGTGGTAGSVSVQFAPGQFTLADADDIKVNVTTSGAYASSGSVTPVVVIEYLPG